MMRFFQKGEVATVMLAVMLVVMVVVGWMGRGHMGMGHSGDQAAHEPAGVDTVRTEKTALELLNEVYARGEISRDEYLRKRDDLQKK